MPVKLGVEHRVAYRQDIMACEAPSRDLNPAAREFWPGNSGKNTDRRLVIAVTATCMAMD
jgi:hypothetical protein